MGGISEANVEWAVINRLRVMLDTPPDTKFNVTLAFSLFSTVLLWTKNRMWVQNPALPADGQAAAARAELGKRGIVDPPWSLSRKAPTKHGAGQVNADFEAMSAENFFKWLRDAIAHGDGRTIRPVHWHGTNGKEWLGGFRIDFNAGKHNPQILTLHLYKRDIQFLGQRLADLFCQHLAGDHNYHFSDEATRVTEAAQ